MKQIKYEERKMIEKMLKSGMGIREIGRAMGRSHATISEEISRNRREYETHYIAEFAQARHEKRQINKGNKEIRK